MVVVGMLKVFMTDFIYLLNGNIMVFYDKILLLETFQTNFPSVSFSVVKLRIFTSCEVQNHSSLETGDSRTGMKFFQDPHFPVFWIEKLLKLLMR